MYQKEIRRDEKMLMSKIYVTRVKYQRTKIANIKMAKIARNWGKFGSLGPAF